MLAKTVEYLDFDGNKRSETLMFNLTKTEALDIAFDLPDDVKDEISDLPDDESKTKEEAAMAIIAKLGDKKIFSFIKEIVLKSYGVKSEDGRRFIKKDENGRPLANEFEETLAYDAIMTELMSANETAAMEFVNGVLPVDALKK